MSEAGALAGVATALAFGNPVRPDATLSAASAILDQLALRAGQVDIWVALVAEVPQPDLAAQYDAVLSDEERRQHGKFVFEKDRRRYLVTRSLVRYVLSRYVPVAPVCWRFNHTAFGKPFIENHHPAIAGLEFNISHSSQVVLLGVTRGRQLGIDVEDLRPDVPLEVATSCFSGKERAQLHALQPALRPGRFLDFWTLKESYIKARGKGLSLPLDEFGFELGTGCGLAVHFAAALNDAPSNWTFWQWRPSPDSIGALCVENQAGVASTITVRRTIPFVREEIRHFDALRMSSL